MSINESSPQQSTIMGSLEGGEGLQLASYEEYVAFCNDGNVTSRKNGILDKDLYFTATEDTRTVSVDIAGRRMPAIVPIEHGLGLGYEVARAKEYAADQADIAVLAIPLTGITEVDLQAIVGGITNYNGALYFSDHNGEDSTLLVSVLEKLGKNYDERPLLDSRAGNSQASLSLYACDAINRETTSETPVGLAAVQRVFDEEVRPTITDPANAVFIENGANLKEDQLSQIWDLYHKKFQFLGENHPISMEDDEMSFFSVLRQPNTTVAFRCVDGKIVCLSDFTEGFDALYWLNDSFLKETASSNVPGVTNLFFPGIVASEEHQGSSRYVIGLFADMAARAGMSTRVLFENTNLSKLYIPRIVEAVVRHTGKFDVKPPEIVDEVAYRLAIIN